MKYLIDRLCEESTWKGLQISFVSLWVAAIDYFGINLKLAVLISAGFIFIVAQILIFTSDYDKTDSRVDDILHAFCNAIMNRS